MLGSLIIGKGVVIRIGMMVCAHRNIKYKNKTNTMETLLFSITIRKIQ